MLFHGRDLNVLSLWEELGVDLPSNLGDNLPTYLPKVVCPNPDHDTFKRHFQINTRKPVVHCFAHCGISGGLERAVAIVLGLVAEGKPDERAARRVIFRHTRTALGRTASAYEGRGNRKSLDADSEVARDQRRLDSGEFQFLPKYVRDYLDNRGIEPAARGKWQLGYCEAEERLIIPAFDERGNFRFLIKRQVKGNSSLKYLYTKGTMKTSILFGACFLDLSKVRSDGLILCEGSLDCIRLHQHGLTNSVAILGTGISKKQVRLIANLGPKRIYTLFDKDMAGVTNILSAKETLGKQPIYVCRYPRGKADPAELTREESERSIERALPITEFLRKTRNVTMTKEAVYG